MDQRNSTALIGLLKVGKTYTIGVRFEFGDMFFDAVIGPTEFTGFGRQPYPVIYNFANATISLSGELITFVQEMEAKTVWKPKR